MSIIEYINQIYAIIS